MRFLWQFLPIVSKHKKMSESGVDCEYVGDLCIYSNPMEILIYGVLKNCLAYQYPEKRVVNSIAEFVEEEEEK